MAYLRWGTKLDDNTCSSKYIFGDDKGLYCCDSGVLIPYKQVREWFKTKKDGEIRALIKNKFELTEAEADCLCERLFFEKDKGEWEEPFEFEKDF